MVGSNLIEVTDAEFDAEVLQSDIPVLVDFWADWCAPCRMVGPVIAQLAEERVGELKVAKLNVDQNRETAAKYKILSIPTVILFRDGKIDRQVVGEIGRAHV